MLNDSTTGGPLLPDSAGPRPLEGQALNQFLQSWFVGLIGIDPTLVRPRWQPEPANIPDAGDYWAAFGITKRTADSYVSWIHDPDADDGLGADIMQRHETLALLVSFYDLGVNGQADYFVSLFMDGLQVPQNRELLDLNAFGLVEASEPTVVPVLLKERWLYRVDIALALRRRITRQYPVRSLLSATGTIVTDSDRVLPFVSTPPPVKPPEPSPPHPFVLGISSLGGGDEI